MIKQVQLHPTAFPLRNFFGGIQYRYVKDRPANNGNSINAAGYFVTDLNLLDTEWKKAQFATESRLINEAGPVEEIHFTPGTPFFVRGRISVNF